MDKNCENGCSPSCAHRSDGLCYWGGVAQGAQALTDAVHRYLRQECLRSELVNTLADLKKKLK